MVRIDPVGDGNRLALTYGADQNFDPSIQYVVGLIIISFEFTLAQKVLRFFPVF